MAIAPHCDFCKTELTDFGGLLFSPPDENGMAKKMHLCKACYERITNEK
ncbi:MAG: hypothetical protein ABA06_00265 [Parcubacteria bacterium C7867-001]|nr:MAG: hypothetical protein ABA06_00265 [Parcubacteria bacterium C7867-001]